MINQIKEIAMFVEVKNLKKSYGNNDNKVQVLKGMSTVLERGEICIILGPSGSGKSTFLNLIGGIEFADEGALLVDGKNIALYNSAQMELYRRDYLGFVFQFYNLVPNLTLKENIQVCEYISSSPLDVDDLIETLGLKEHQNKYPFQVSGGQQQRCAIARALVKNPELLLCDEPTGALDSKTSKEILILIEKVNRKYGTTIFIVTHNEVIKDMVHKVIVIKDGNIVEEYRNKNVVSAQDLAL
jgi:putative ABC transport system ATP-binding protein